MEVLAPVQEGANRALKPVRDLFGWFGDTIDAKGQRDELETERDQLRQQVARLQVAEQREQGAARARSITAPARGSRTTPRSPRASTAARTRPGTRRSRSTRARATASDVNQPVVNGEGLVGKVKTVSDGNAVVMLLTDTGLRRLRARLAGRPAGLRAAGRPGARRPAVRPRARREGRPQGRQHRHRGHRRRTGCRPRYPQGILIGTVTQGRPARRPRPDDPRHARRRPAQPRLRRRC